MSEQATSSATPPAAPLRARLAAARGNPRVLLAAGAVALAAILGFLYFKAQGADFSRQSEPLALLRELKEIDGRWDADVLRIRTEIAPGPAPAVDYGPRVARLRESLAAAARESGSAVLQSGVRDLAGAFAQKAELVEKFRNANAATKHALERVLSADVEIAGLVRGSWQEIRDREGVVALEAAVSHLISDAQKYYYGAGEAHRKDVEALASDLRESAAQVPPAVRAGLARLDANVQQLLGAKPVEEELFRKLALVTAGPRADSLAGAYAREMEARLADREFYRTYLAAFSGALLIVIGYLGTRLALSYRRLDRANAELERLAAERARELSRALDELKGSEAQLVQTEKMSSLGEMVAGVAHEINTPLAYVKSSLGAVQGRLPDLAESIAEAQKLVALLKEGGADPDALARQFALVEKRIAALGERRALDELQALVKDGRHGIDQISEIVTNMLSFTRPDRSRVTSYNLNEGLESTMLLARHELKRHNIQRRYEDIPPITCSASQINQVLLNLLNNAAQAVEPESGTITLTTHKEDDAHVAVEIEDNGKGIPPDVLPKIFDPFFTTRDNGRGGGLGLSIAHKIVSEHGGRITVDSAVGIGTKFKLVLPLTPPAEEAAAQPAGAASGG